MMSITRRQRNEQPAMILINIPIIDPEVYAYCTPQGFWLFGKHMDEVISEAHELFCDDEVAIECFHTERAGYPIMITEEWAEFLNRVTDKYQPSPSCCNTDKITMHDILLDQPIVIVPNVFTYAEAVCKFRDSVRLIFP